MAKSERRKTLLIGAVWLAPVRPSLSWPFHGSSGEKSGAGCNEAPYLAAEGGNARVTRGQLERNNECFLLLFRVLGFIHFFKGGRGSRERKAKSSTERK